MKQTFQITVTREDYVQARHLSDNPPEGYRYYGDCVLARAFTRALNMPVIVGINQVLGPSCELIAEMPAELVQLRRLFDSNREVDQVDPARFRTYEVELEVPA